MYSKQVMGIPLAGSSAVPAEQVLYTQAGICGCAGLSSVISLIFTLIIFYQYKNSFQDLTEAAQKDIPEQEKQISGYLSQIYLVGILQVFEACCIFSVVFGAIYYFVKTRQRVAIKACCWFDACCTGLMVLDLCAVCFYFVFMCWMASVLSNAAEVCASVTTPAPPATAATTSAQCEAVVTALQNPATTAAVWLGFTSVFLCFFVCLCGYGAKTANDLSNALEDEEYGGYGGGYTTPGVGTTGYTAGGGYAPGGYSNQATYY